jgi:hypothetical protein
MACTQTATPIRAQIDGSHQLIQVGDLLFVTATDANELRVIDMAASDFVRAPNPLHPLSVPVVDRPISLARDVVWSGDGSTSGARYVYALSESGRELSIVGADPGSLQELAIYREAGQVVTAVAGQADPPAVTDSPPGPSKLLVATYDGFDSRILSLTLPEPLTPGSKLSGGTVVTQLACASITSLLVLPNHALAWSSRPAPCRDGSTPPPPRAEIIDLSGGGAATPLAFPTGIAIRKIFTHDRSATHLGAERIFGILDEASCGGGSSCRGIFAVAGPGKTSFNPPGSPCDTAMGDAACDFSGVRMLPIGNGRSLIMDAALISGAMPKIAPPKELGAPTLIGLYTTSDGRIVFFDAEKLRHFDIDSRGASMASFAVRAADGSALTHEPGPTDPVTLANGAARNEIISFTFLGDLPGFSRSPQPIESASIDTKGVDPVGIVDVGDVACEQPAQDGSTDCTRTATVSAVAPAAISLDRPVGGAGSTVSIRPPDATPTPWVVVGTGSGFLGRIAASPSSVELPADDAKRRALFLNRPLDYNDADPPPYLTLIFLTPPSLASLDASALRGVHVDLNIDAAFKPAEVTVAPNADLSFPVVASGLAFRPTDPDKGQLFVAFPSSDAVARFEETSLEAGTSASGYTTFR